MYWTDCHVILWDCIRRQFHSSQYSSLFAIIIKMLRWNFMCVLFNLVFEIMPLWDLISVPHGHFQGNFRDIWINKIQHGPCDRSTVSRRRKNAVSFFLRRSVGTIEAGPHAHVVQVDVFNTISPPCSHFNQLHRKYTKRGSWDMRFASHARITTRRLLALSNA